MDRRSLLLGMLGLPGLVAGRGAWANLEEYVKKTDPDFHWTKDPEAQVGEVKIINLKMKSQVWREIPWEHTVQIFVPKKVTHANTALLLITGGSPGPTDTLLGAAIAPKLEAPTVVLYNIPNQPLLGGKREDDLIAETFQQYLASADETWPLLFPMVKSAVAAMDAVQEYTKKEWDQPIKDFIVTGASKRGWTTYLTAASDKRVRALAPMVFDNLNFSKQMPRQLELWGKYSEQIEDYSRRGLQQKMEMGIGKKLVSMVDPWFYRKQLTQPKLLIHGANDRYWATDATRQYWDDLPDPKYLISIPNAGHGLEDRERLLNTLVAFFHATAADKPLPRLKSRTEGQENGKLTVVVDIQELPKAARLWTARSADLDFRPVKWQPEMDMVLSQKGWVANADRPKSGGLAFFAEAEFEQEGRKYTLTTPPQVIGTRGA